MITTNTGAKKLESSDNWREIFPNSTLGTAGAHNASVDAADRIQPEIAPIINGKQCALGAAKDDYVLLRNSTITGKSDGAYIAAKAIPANTDIDSTYLGNAITGGISNSINSNIAQLPICRLLKRSNITQSPGYDNWTISGFTQLSGYTRRVIAINPSVQYITFIRTDDSSGDQITVYLYNSNNSSVTFNLEVIGIYIPNNLVAS